MGNRGKYTMQEKNLVKDSFFNEIIKVVDSLKGKLKPKRPVYFDKEKIEAASWVVAYLSENNNQIQYSIEWDTVKRKFKIIQCYKYN